MARIRFSQGDLRQKSRIKFDNHILDNRFCVVLRQTGDIYLASVDYKIYASDIREAIIREFPKTNPDKISGFPSKQDLRTLLHWNGQLNIRKRKMFAVIDVPVQLRPRETEAALQSTGDSHPAIQPDKSKEGSKMVVFKPIWYFKKMKINKESSAFVTLERNYRLLCNLISTPGKSFCPATNIRKKMLQAILPHFYE